MRVLHLTLPSLVPARTRSRALVVSRVTFVLLWLALCPAFGPASALAQQGESTLASPAAEAGPDAASTDAGSTTPGTTSRGFWWHLGQTTPAGVTDPATPQGNWWKRLWAGQETLRRDGGFDVFVSGWAYHPPTSYTEDKKERLNENAWGTGVGRTIVDSGAQHRSLYLFVSQDSHDDPQVMAGYSWLARTPTPGLRLGAGYTFMMIARDEFGYIPVPFAAPLFSLDVGPVQAMVSYVPKYDVWYFFGRIAVRSQRSGTVAARK